MRNEEEVLRWKMCAINLMPLLPQDKEEATFVLEYAQDLVNQFLFPRTVQQQEAPNERRVVLSLVKPETSGTAHRRPR
jgi:hypothetical protein